ncbi:MAG TPA: SgcJ/EcaC family oxidoreductase [Isosphaeraceae bacterium]|jgi:uncharacterized protein (TIGR02246 family)|nr:SgcJ/EcaC family oxidoreductase [Isosphaeraceae bacterium]
MKAWTPIIGLLALGACLVLRAQDAPKSATAARPGQAAAAPKGAERGDDERAIRALVDTFTKAFNAGDAAAVAATYTDGAVVVDEDGQRTVGRAAIQGQYAGSFADGPGAKIAIRAESLHFLGPETALEEGRAIVTPAAGLGDPESSRYTAIYVKHGGLWHQAAVRDMPDKDLTPHDHLKELEWLTGEWVNESEDAVVSTTCKWADGGNFLVREFTMKVRGVPAMTGVQRIGWDPVRKQFKSWMFDSEGGFLEAYWTHRDNQWVVKSEGATSTGQATSMTNIITRLGKDRASWQSVDRTVGGAAVPGIDEFTIVRKPPEVGK